MLTYRQLVTANLVLINHFLIDTRSQTKITNTNKTKMKEGSIKWILIQSIKAREVLDSRGNPTVEVEVRSECGAFW